MTSLKLNLSRFISVQTFPEPYQRYAVASGDARMGQTGLAIASIGLKHAGGYEIVLHLDNGKQDSFNPLQLFPIRERTTP